MKWWSILVWVAGLASLWGLLVAVLAYLRYVDTNVIWDGEYL